MSKRFNRLNISPTENQGNGNNQKVQSRYLLKPGQYKSTVGLGGVGKYEILHGDKKTMKPSSSHKVIGPNARSLKTIGNIQNSGSV